MASKLKRVSEAAEAAVETIRIREDRTFVAQLDRIVTAGLTALGEDVPTELQAGDPTPTPTTARKPARAVR